MIKLVDTVLYLTFNICATKINFINEILQNSKTSEPQKLFFHKKKIKFLQTANVHSCKSQTLPSSYLKFYMISAHQIKNPLIGLIPFKGKLKQ